VVPLGDDAARRAFTLVTTLRRAGIATDVSFGGRGIKGAMKAADRSGADHALILGDRDLEAGVVQLKDLRTGDQTAVRLDDVLPALRAALDGRTPA
jgi:histidyl-tRNA synthetase